MRHRSMFLAAALATALAAPLAAQEWRGRARVDGQVKNDKGEPVEGCVVKLRWGKSGHGGPDEKTDKKGKWAIFGLAGGPWDLDFDAPGYKTRQIQVTLSETGRNDSVEVALEPAPQAAAVAPTQEILVGGQKISKETALAIEAGNAAMTAQNWPVARENYVKALGELPDNASIIERVAVAYLAEGNKDEALRYARLASEKAPADTQPWQIIAELEIEKGNAEAGLAALDRVPREKILDPALYLNAGISLYNSKKLPEAIGAFDKAIAVKPDATAYYYRGLAELQQKKNAEAKADFQKALELAPDGPDAKDIKELLKSIR
jgi:tetratricopeptide (TPR) repeat protein